MRCDLIASAFHLVRLLPSVFWGRIMSAGWASPCRGFMFWSLAKVFQHMFLTTAPGPVASGAEPVRALTPLPLCKQPLPISLLSLLVGFSDVPGIVAQCVQ